MGIGTLRRHYTKPKAEPVAEEAPAPVVDVPNQDAPPADVEASAGGAPVDPEVNAESGEGNEGESTELQASLPMQSPQPQQHHRGSRRR